MKSGAATTAATTAVDVDDVAGLGMADLPQEDLASVAVSLGHGMVDVRDVMTMMAVLCVV